MEVLENAHELISYLSNHELKTGMLKRITLEVIKNPQGLATWTAKHFEHLLSGKAIDEEDPNAKNTESILAGDMEEIRIAAEHKLRERGDHKTADKVRHAMISDKATKAFIVNPDTFGPK